MKSITAFFAKRKYFYIGIAPILLTLTYGALSYIPSLYVINTSFDNAIPFCEYFVIPYVLWYAFFGGSCLLCLIFSRIDYIKLVTLITFGVIVCQIIYLIFPNEIGFRPTDLDVDKNLFTRIVGSIYEADRPSRANPSEHATVSLCIAVWAFGTRLFGKRRLPKYMILAFALLICVSCLFIKQHSWVDIVSAVGVTGVIYYPATRFSAWLDRKYTPVHD